ncbi:MULTISPECIES: fumarylacetoacetate hydrolase family protein [unclassified Shewanella]|uniref:fumarylacetoacetate hydrolase family protein n=1 Tax=unclassified Shewanella TaxID=196818 RepID=UPI0006D687CA|nr:fumarylacetoacetate hydrolase family protein [Shewanella sp. P1-14-1]KPZ72944.1 Homoprotocatechuate catabolism bifunctional isomerase/decarboxylase [Shewanella sp. P1-14-1]
MLKTVYSSSGQERLTPSKIICIGRNYVDHINELGNEVPDDMVVFLKPNSSISDTLVSFHQEPIHFETELCFMVKDGQFSAVGVGLDLTKRALQSTLKAKQLPWERAKAFNGSAVFSEFVALPLINNHTKFCFQLTIDGEIVQFGHSDLMMYSVSDIHTAISEFLSLEDGDIVMTGTPKGVGMITKGATFEVKLWVDIEYESFEQLLDAVKDVKPIITQTWIAE